MASGTRPPTPESTHWTSAGAKAGPWLDGVLASCVGRPVSEYTTSAAGNCLPRRSFMAYHQGFEEPK